MPPADTAPHGADLLYEHLLDEYAMIPPWSSGGAYEDFMGRWSRLVAPEFVSWLGVAPGARWLDVGSGTGALTQAILDSATPIEVTGVDPSAGLLTWAEAQIPDLRARFTQAEAERLPFDSAHFDVAVSGLVLDAMAEPELAMAEMTRVVREGGTVAAYVWDYADGMSLLRAFWDGATILDPRAAAADEGQRASLCRLEPLFALFEDAGMTEVNLTSISTEAVFHSFDDLWGPFLAGQGRAPHYAMSLSPNRRELLRMELERSLPFAADGSLTLPLRAWAIRGIRRAETSSQP